MAGAAIAPEEPIARRDRNLSHPYSRLPATPALVADHKEDAPATPM
jgi:hypothetical protein